MVGVLRRLLRPQEGVLSSLLLLTMLLSLGGAVRGADILPGTAFVFPSLFVGFAFGVAASARRLRATNAVGVGAVAGAAVVIALVSAEYGLPADAQIDRLLALRTDLVGWAATLLAGGWPSAASPAALLLGGVLWGTGFVAARAVFRRRRPGDAVLVLGAVMVGVQSISRTDELAPLVPFTAAALGLWVVAVGASRRRRLRTRRIRASRGVVRAPVRLGFVAVIAIVAMAWTLSATLIGAPLSSTWGNLQQLVAGMQGPIAADQGLQGAGSLPLLFGSGALIRGEWKTDKTPVMTVTGDGSAYLAFTSYQEYTRHGWFQPSTSTRTVDAGGLITPNGSPDRPGGPTRETTLQVQLNRSTGRSMVMTGTPLSVDRKALALRPDGASTLVGLDATQPLPAGDTYELTVAVSTATSTQLESAGTEYPREITDLYTNTTGVSQPTKDLAKKIAARTDPPDPFDVAQRLADYLQATYHYSNDPPPPTAGEDIVDWFLFRSKEGYCQHFASAMVALARSVGIPARFVMGLHQDGRQGGGRTVYLDENLHAWAELYFPGYGWQVFESTAGFAPVQRAAGGPAGSEARLASSSPIPTSTPAGSSAPEIGSVGGEGSGPVLPVAAALLTLLLASALWLIWHRRLRAPPHSDAWLWRSFVRAAQRAGLGPRPSETVYEYASWLEDQLPARRPEIDALARGRVVRTYAGRSLGSDELAGMASAWGRVRGKLTWLAVRARLRRLLRRRD